MAFDEKYMRAAIAEAKKAEKKGECPIGCVIVYGENIIARAHNLRETRACVVNHAEILALQKANRKLSSWRLDGCDLYVTLEPCAMCAGAIIQSRIRSVYFGAFDEKAGVCGSVADLFVPGMFNHDVAVSGGILRGECAALLSDFFARLRAEKKEKRRL